MSKKTLEFYIDTADPEYIKKCWDRLGKYFKPENLLGVTTNPNAMYKVGVGTLKEFKKQVRQLDELLEDIKPESERTIFVQGPSSGMTPKEVKRFAKMISKWEYAVGLKIPPFLPILEIAEELSRYLYVNVTGIADCSTALCCLTYPVDFISIIPGRMEEKGINAREQIQFVNQRNCSDHPAKIITGSMRTLEGLRWVIQEGTIPTIGTKVFDQIIDKDENIKKFKDMWKEKRPIKRQDLRYSPLVAQEQTGLSVAFFEQMDECGKSLYRDLKKNKKV